MKGSSEVTSQHAVYRLFAEDGGVLYVGSSTDPYGRILRHSRRTDLVSAVRRVVVTYHDTLDEALAEERAEIARLRPPMNVRSLPTATPAGKAAPGEARELVISALRQIGRPTTSSEVTALVGFPSSAHLKRLRDLGIVTVRDVLPCRGFRTGRPEFLLELVA